MNESLDKCTDGAGNEISRPGTLNISFFIKPADVRPIPHLTTKCSAPVD